MTVLCVKSGNETLILNGKNNLGSEDAEAVRFDSGGCEIIIQGTDRFGDMHYYVVWATFERFPPMCGYADCNRKYGFWGKREKVS